MKMGEMNGGFAFPSGDMMGLIPGSGISKREYFVGQALMGLCANPCLVEKTYEVISEHAIKHADAALAHLSAQTEPADQGAEVVALTAENERLREKVERLQSALEHIGEYWNRDQNETAMADALWHIIETAEEALQPVGA